MEFYLGALYCHLWVILEKNHVKRLLKCSNKTLKHHQGLLFLRKKAQFTSGTLCEGAIMAYIQYFLLPAIVMGSNVLRINK